MPRESHSCSGPRGLASVSPSEQAPSVLLGRDNTCWGAGGRAGGLCRGRPAARTHQVVGLAPTGTLDGSGSHEGVALGQGAATWCQKQQGVQRNGPGIGPQTRKYSGV